ncbi:MAG: DUF4157 domain-containing protein [Acidobacteria bacterium]|nr:DUF4157 domain-containing protein [Acidobacteriota bacterium]
MSSAKQFLAILVCLLLSLPPVFAQDPQSPAKVGQKLTVIIERQQVLFTAQSDIEQLQLQIFNQTGELVFDSGQVTVNQLIWPFQNVYGETIKSGLYAYALSVKETGVTEARVRRGHFIVDRAQDRDGATDKMWVTSQNDNGVGAELTVARDENTTIAGAIAPRRGGGNERGEVKRDGEAKKDEKSAQAELAVAGTGLPGQIAKFISEEEIGGSEITEVDGNIGIGTTDPKSKLTVATPTASYGFSHTDRNAILSSWVGADSGGGNSGWLGTRTKHSLHFFTADGPARMTINAAGNVGIGITPLTSRLTVDGQDALLMRGFEPFLTLNDANSMSEHRIQSAHGDLGFFRGRFIQQDLVGIYQYSPAMVIKESGNVGIGTANPVQRLHVLGDYSGIRLQSTRSDVWTVTEYATNAREWHTGVGGSTVPNDLKNKYYIYDATAGRARLTIDTNGEVSVDTLRINGADFAERFDVSSAPATDSEAAPLKVEAGMVVSIDPANPGKLMLSAQPFDPQVAGIISGAGGVKAMTFNYRDWGIGVHRDCKSCDIFDVPCHAEWLVCQALRAKQIALGKPVEGWILLSREAAISAGVSPIPANIRNKLGHLFPASLLNKVRFKTGSGFLGSLQWFRNEMEGKGAITLVDVIVFVDANKAANDVKLWAHELEHVRQYDQLGVDGFAQAYVDQTCILPGDSDLGGYDSGSCRLGRQAEKKANYYNKSEFVLCCQARNAPATLFLFNRLLNGTEQFVARESIIVGPNVTLQAGGVVTLRAGRVITMRPGFRSEAGGKLFATIEPSLSQSCTQP